MSMNYDRILTALVARVENNESRLRNDILVMAIPQDKIFAARTG
ncbi:17347_t:CDS:2 [Gigaspora rosea]|nr:17347_t:CDS:2 [Gigaspora rosea]